MVNWHFGDISNVAVKTEVRIQDNPKVFDPVLGLKG